MKTLKINENDFFGQYAIYDLGKVIAIVKVERGSNQCYEVEMMNKSPSLLIRVYDFIRLKWNHQM